MNCRNFFLIIFSTCYAISALGQPGGNPQKYSAAQGNPACRFFDGFKENGDGTVLDPRTKLTWKKCPEGASWSGQRCTGAAFQIDWFSAVKIAERSEFLGFKDWRLPTYKELVAIAGDAGSDSDKKCTKNPEGTYAMSSSLVSSENHPQRGDPYFLSSTDAADEPNIYVYMLNPRRGALLALDDVRRTNERMNVRLVRDLSGQQPKLIDDSEAEKYKQAARLDYEQAEKRLNEPTINKPVGRIEISRQGNSSTYTIVCPGRAKTGTVTLPTSPVGNICATGADPICRPRDSWSLQAAAAHVCR